MAPFSKDKFISMSKEKYGEKFDYSGINYKSYVRDKIIIKCIEHNLCINIYPNNHIKQLSGGCLECVKKHTTTIIKKKTPPKKIILNDEEILKDILLLNYTHYCITNTGRCFSKKTGKELSKYIISGYYHVNLYDTKDIVKHFSIHYLTYIVFNNDHDTKKVIDHIDGNKLNNNIENLRCITQSKNVINAYKNNDKMYQQNIIQAYNKENVLVKEFNTINEAKIFINHKNTGSISNCLRGIYKTSGGFIWKFKNKDI